MATTPALEKLLTETEAADMLGLQPNTLAVWRMTGKYQLPFVKLGKAVRYRPGDLQAWLDRRTVGRVVESAA